MNKLPENIDGNVTVYVKFVIFDCTYYEMRNTAINYQFVLYIKNE